MVMGDSGGDRKWSNSGYILRFVDKSGGGVYMRQSNGAAERWREEHQGLIQGFCPEQLEGWISIKWDMKILCKKLLKSSFSVLDMFSQAVDRMCLEEALDWVYWHMLISVPRDKEIAKQT